MEPEEIERRFDIPTTRFLCHTEQTYYHLSYQEALQRARSIAAAVDTLFEDHSFEYAFQGRGGEIFRLLVHYRMRKEGGVSIWIAFDPFDGTRVFATRLDNRWDTYETVPYEEITEEERAQCWQYIESFRKEKKRYTHDDSIPQKSSVWEQITSKLSEAREIRSSDRPNNLVRNARYAAVRTVNGYINQKLQSSVAESRRLCENETYVFFPLQFPEESRLAVYSPEFYDQKWIIEYLSRSVPHDTSVFIKQHPNHPGVQSPLWIRELSGLPNVQFLHPETNAHVAVEHAEASVVTNNTVGFETLFYSTPLIVLGQAFYRETPAAWTVDDLTNLRSVVRMATETETSDEDRIASIHSLRKSVYELDSTETIEDEAIGTTAALLSFVTNELNSNTNRNR